MMSTLGSATSSLYDPYVLAELGPSMAWMNLAADSAEVEEATATISWRMSLTPRMAGSVRRSLAKAV